MTCKTTPLKNAGMASTYHGNDDYYFGKEVAPSQWSGELAKRLGIDGQKIDKDIFKHLLNGRIPTALLPENQTIKEHQNEHTNDRSSGDDGRIKHADSGASGGAADSTAGAAAGNYYTHAVEPYPVSLRHARQS